MDPSIDKLVEQYAACLVAQHIEGLCSLLSPDVQLEGLQTGNGRLEVLRCAARLFKWYSPWGVTARSAAGTQVIWEKSGVQIWDDLQVNAETLKIEGIVRKRKASNTFDREYSVVLQCLLAVVNEQPSKTSLLATSSPRRQRRGPPYASLAQSFSKSCSPAVNPLCATAASLSSSTTTSSVQPIPPTASAGRPVLDFSFKEITNLRQLIYLEPRAGQRAKKQSAEKAQKEAAAAAATIREERKTDVPEELMLVKAKSKKEGTEMAYSWDRNDPERYSLTELMRDEQAANLPAVTTTVPLESCPKYLASSVKLSNNLLTDASQLSKCLKVIIHHSVINLSFLDLSCNELEILPTGLEEFPIQVLYLHSNNISRLEEVKKLANITTLHSLTLWSNPLENKGNYKMRVLDILCPGFKGNTVLRKLDHAVISRGDAQNCRMFREFTVVAAENNRQRSKGIM